MFDIAYTAQAIDDLRWFKRYEQTTILNGIDQQLRHEPHTATRNRKRLRSNPTADWELRLGEFRILYNVDTEVQIVEIQRVGEKRRNALFFRGRKEDL
jgi:mRNA-degrading endonuclease RelE of RelBE toxin-antitoxin system